MRIREEPLIAGLNDFFNREIFGAHRRGRLETLLVRLDDRHLREHEGHVAALVTEIADLGRRRARVLDPLEQLDDPSEAFVQNINERAAQIAADLEAAQAKLREVRSAAPPRPYPELLDLLPAGAIDPGRVPGPVLRRLLDVLRLRMRYDRKTGRMDCEVTITSEIVGTQHDAAAAAIGAAETGSRAGLRRTPYGVRRRPAPGPTPPNARLTIPSRFPIP
ncbi:hypothetical protein [Actinomadura sp. K4S16]|uniref:hypothetical protein n=1 Tax=Actinomadura sp. K4S16 TaxID=1316147 RepID=UPI0011EEA13E|nr:hypothetical protein [Actinomadura sp. K4S16]